MDDDRKIADAFWRRYELLQLTLERLGVDREQFVSTVAEIRRSFAEDNSPAGDGAQ